MTGYEQYDEVALKALAKQGPMTPSELGRAVEIDQFSEREALEWIPGAGERGLIETIDGLGPSARYTITDKGRSAIS